MVLKYIDEIYFFRMSLKSIRTNWKLYTRVDKLRIPFFTLNNFIISTINVQFHILSYQFQRKWLTFWHSMNSEYVLIDWFFLIFSQIFFMSYHLIDLKICWKKRRRFLEISYRRTWILVVQNVDAFKILPHLNSLPRSWLLTGWSTFFINNVVVQNVGVQSKTSCVALKDPLRTPMSELQNLNNSRFDSVNSNFELMS